MIMSVSPVAARKPASNVGQPQFHERRKNPDTHGG
jgi:hypothetical protein